MTGGEGVQALLDRASRLQRTGRIVEAIGAYEHLLALRPDLAESWYNLGWLRRQARLFEESLAAYEQALERGVSSPEEAHLNRGVILADHLGRPADAQAELESALRLNPAYVPALLNLGNLHEDRGRRADARDAYERALTIEPDNMLALARLAGVAEVAAPDDPIVGRMRQALAQPGIDAIDRADLGFALGRMFDAACAYDEAFAAYAEANRASRASFGPGFRGYDRAAQEQFVDRIIATFPVPVGANGTGDATAPIFICGMFRSGSTLAEQILASHGSLTAGGELDLVPELAARLQPYPEAAAKVDESAIAELRDRYLARVRAMHPQAERITDKRPDNFLHIGLIKRLFPDAKIVHTVRNPLDNILSVWFLHLGPDMSYALDLEDAAHWHGQYRRLMAHWQSLYANDIFDLDYDSLVADPRPGIAALLEFLGLPWQDSCLDFHQADNIVKTASAWQVRVPLYRRASGRWRNYARHLDAVKRQLEAAQLSS